MMLPFHLSSSLSLRIVTTAIMKLCIKFHVIHKNMMEHVCAASNYVSICACVCFCKFFVRSFFEIIRNKLPYALHIVSTLVLNNSSIKWVQMHSLERKEKQIPFNSNITMHPGQMHQEKKKKNTLNRIVLNE